MLEYRHLRRYRRFDSMIMACVNLGCKINISNIKSGSVCKYIVTLEYKDKDHTGVSWICLSEAVRRAIGNLCSELDMEDEWCLKNL